MVADSDVVAGMEDIYARMDDRGLGEDWDERLTAVRLCIAALPEVMHRALKLVYALGLEVVEAAGRAGERAETFQRRLSRAREKVRECVESKLRLEALR